MKHRIEITGVAELTERIREHRADVTVSVRAAQIETAFAEALTLKQHVIRTLLDNGMVQDELKEGGSETWRPWYWKKKVGQEASHRLLIACDDIARMQAALAALEPLFDNQRYSITVSMRRPEFAIDDDAQDEARREAMRDARRKADALAEEAGLTVTHALRIEELGVAEGRTGMYGDEQWHGAVTVAAGAGRLDEDEPISLDKPTRSTHVRFRVKFACSPRA